MADQTGDNTPPTNGEQDAGNNQSAAQQPDNAQDAAAAAAVGQSAAADSQPVSEFSVKIDDGLKDILTPMANELKSLKLTSEQAQAIIDKAAGNIKAREGIMAAEEAKLDAAWKGEKEDFKKEAVNEMKRQGFTLEEITTMSSAAGFANVVQKFYAAAQRNKSGSVPNPPNVQTAQNLDALPPDLAARRLDEKLKDKAFNDKLIAGDAAAKMELKKLIAAKRGVAVNSEGKYVGRN